MWSIFIRLLFQNNSVLPLYVFCGIYAFAGNYTACLFKWEFLKVLCSLWIKDYCIHILLFFQLEYHMESCKPFYCTLASSFLCYSRLNTLEANKARVFRCPFWLSVYGILIFHPEGIFIKATFKISSWKDICIHLLQFYHLSVGSSVNKTLRSNIAVAGGSDFRQ